MESIESVSSAKVVSADLDSGIVTLEIEHPVQGDDTEGIEECYECGGTCNYHESWCPYNYA